MAVDGFGGLEILVVIGGGRAGGGAAHLFLLSEVDTWGKSELGERLRWVWEFFGPRVGGRGVLTSFAGVACGGDMGMCLCMLLLSRARNAVVFVFSASVSFAQHNFESLFARHRMKRYDLGTNNRVSIVNPARPGTLHPLGLCSGGFKLPPV